MKKNIFTLLILLFSGVACAATDTSKPYIGSQTPNSSDGLNNGAIQEVSPWGTNVTGVMGDTLGYITPSNTATTGGVWAGNKAAALTFGNQQTGFFVDSTGAQIKNSPLNLNNNKVVNLSDGVADKDAVNVSQLKKSAQDTLNSANTYTDNKATQTLETANTYTDNKASQTLETANTYTDNKATQTLETANSYTDNKATQTLQTANTYTDNTATKTLKTANTYTDGQTAQTLKTANAYTDNKSKETLGAANAYADRKIDSLDKKMNQGLASSAALSGLFQPYGVGKFNFSAGIGGYRSESAIAVGSGYRFTDNFAAKAGVSTSTNEASAVMYNASVNIEW